jgi:HD-like signal output (HDOD) protein
MAQPIAPVGSMRSLAEAVTEAFLTDQVFRAANSPKFGRSGSKTTQNSTKRRVPKKLEQLKNYRAY